MELGTLEEVKLIVDQIASNKIPPPNKAQSLVIIRQMVRMAEQIESLMAERNQAGVELSQCILDKMEQAKQLAECKKNSERWKAIVAEAERDYVEVPKHTEPYWEILECAEAMEEWADDAIAAQKEEYE